LKEQELSSGQQPMKDAPKYMRRYRLTHRTTTDDMPWEREPVSTGFQYHLLVLFCHVVVRQSYLRMYLCTLRVDS
jgi:hypothetical protein